MSRISLSFWDLPYWHDDRSYSPFIADVLGQAYAFLFKDDLMASKLRAHATVQPYLSERMSEHQRLRVYYVLGLGFAADGKYALALFCFDEALERAALLGPAADEIELYTLKAGVNRAAFEFSEAVDDCRIALEILSEENLKEPNPDKLRQIRLLGQIAGLEFFLTRFDDAQQHLDEGFTLATLAESDRLASGLLHSSQAHLDQLTGRYATAITHAEWAADAFQQAGHSVSAGRLRCLCADILVRHAEELARGDERDALLARAAQTVVDARQVLVGTTDDIGLGLIELVDVRLSRLTARNEDRMARIEQVIALARKWDDTALLVQTFTALGDELAARVQMDSAKYRYRDAIALMDGGEAPALAIWPQRSLLRHSEMDG